MHKHSIDPISDFPQVQLPSVRGTRDQQGPSLPGWVGVCLTGLLRSHGAVPLGLRPVLPRLVSRLLPVSLGPSCHLGVCTLPRPVLPPVSLCFDTWCLASNPWFVFVPRLTSFIHSMEAWPPTLQELIGSDKESCYPSGLHSQLWCWGPALPASRLVLGASWPVLSDAPAPLLLAAHCV